MLTTSVTVWFRRTVSTASSREHVTPLIKDEHFEDMYCPDNGPSGDIAGKIGLRLHITNTQEPV